MEGGEKRPVCGQKILATSRNFAGDEKVSLIQFLIFYAQNISSTIFITNNKDDDQHLETLQVTTMVSPNS